MISVYCRFCSVTGRSGCLECDARRRAPAVAHPLHRNNLERAFAPGGGGVREIMSAFGKALPAAMSYDEAMQVPVVEMDVLESLEYVDLEVAHSPVVPAEGDSMARACRAEVLGDGTYRVFDPRFPDPVSATALARMRCRFLIDNGVVAMRSGRPPAWDWPLGD